MYLNSCNYTFYINIVDYYINTIGDMQSEMDFVYHCNEFEYNQDFVIFLVEFFYDTLEFDVLNNDEENEKITICPVC